MGILYTVNENLRIFDNGADEIRLRMGIWNYNEAALDLTGQTEGLKAAMRDMFARMQSGKGFDSDEVDKYDISKEDKESILGILEGLKATEMVRGAKERETTMQISMALLGDFRYYIRPDNNEALVDSNRKALFISDNKYCKKNAVNLAEDMEFKVEVISEELYKKIETSDFTTRVDAFATISKMEEIKKELQEYAVIMVCMQAPKLTMLRNLNRLSLELEKPVVSAFIDGPFITAFTVNPGITGCIECFEQRALSRMEDHVSYHKFVDAKVCSSTESNKGYIPTLNMLTNLVVSEGYLINTIGASKFEGRVLSVYVPSFEIQVDDILRVPFCPACGNVAKADFTELNISSRRIMDDIVSGIMK